MNFFPLNLRANARHPSLGTFWYLVSRLLAGMLEQALGGWGVSEEEKDYAMDGKALQGSKRAALHLLESEELEGKVVSADAGLLKAPFVQKVVQKKGAILA